MRQIKDTWPPVIIEWLDAKSVWGDMTLDEASKSSLPIRRSIGFLIHMDLKEVRVFGTDDRKNTLDNAGSDMLIIPAGMVVEIIALKEEKKCPSPNPSKKAQVKSASVRSSRKPCMTSSTARTTKTGRTSKKSR